MAKKAMRYSQSVHVLSICPGFPDILQLGPCHPKCLLIHTYANSASQAVGSLVLPDGSWFATDLGKKTKTLVKSSRASRDVASSTRAASYPLAMSEQHIVLEERNYHTEFECYTGDRHHP